MKNKFNLNIDEDFKKYTFNQIIFILIIILFFFVLFYYNFGLVMASLTIWSLLFFGVLFLYLDIKFMYKHQLLKKQLENIEYILKNKK